MSELDHRKKRMTIVIQGVDYDVKTILRLMKKELKRFRCVLIDVNIELTAEEKS